MIRAAYGILRTIVPCVLLFTSADLSRASDNAQPPSALMNLVIYPSEISLEHQRDYQRIVIIGTNANGATRDVTSQAAISFSSDGVAAYKDGLLRPLNNGESVLRAVVESISAEATVRVKNAGQTMPISFRNDVLPIFMKAGCNSGACHGSAQGREGFRLSLFGFEPEKDYISLTRDLGARRTDLAEPGRSLVLHKPLEKVPHGGGRRFSEGSELHDVLAEWIATRTPNDPPNVPKLTGIEIMPSEAVLRGKGNKLKLVVQARYSDGTERDVTSLALFSSSDTTTIIVDDTGSATSGLKGEAFVMARYGTFAVVSQFIVLDDDVQFNWEDEAIPVNEIDEAVNAKLKKLQINPSPICSDEVFLRRIYLDIIGLLPTVEEYRTFMADEAADKRSRLIDRLLQRPEFPELWAMKWAELLRIESGSRRITHKAMYLYNAWLRDAILSDKPMDELVRELLGAEGGNFSNPAANFYLVGTQPTEMAENVAQVFCGIRIQCAQCHNHPFERWTQDDYYSFAAFFSQVGRKKTDDLRETVIHNTQRGEVAHPRSGQRMNPKFLGGAAPASFRGGDRRKELAAWLTSKDNPYFAACFVDRVWAHFMGKGLVDPPDDVRVSNPPSHPMLREKLARRFVESKYDLRTLVRMICNSNVYQRSSRFNPANEKDSRNFSHALPRRLSAETVLDILCGVTEVPEKFKGLPLGARAVQIADSKSGSYFLDVFGRPPRLSACTCERRNEPTLSQALHLINGDTIQRKITAPKGRLSRLLNAGADPRAVIEDLYVSAYCRKPTDIEIQRLLKSINETEDKKKGLEDIYWAVLNSKEFIFNH